MMATERLEYKFTQYQHALRRLKEAAERQNDADNFIADAAIQRFEFVLELAWKLLKCYLEEEGITNINTPVEVLKEAYVVGVISNGDRWLEMVKKRNLTSHTYDERTAVAIYEAIKSEYLPLLTVLSDTMSTKI
ncbi:MAG: nucleotidyltransferase substrate binding protein [Coriobacteriales bacterium]|jgi:nucleotidyltransferase substrate binding protein (TIGR01987 family)|nr:nucleotidyltransferase substrate binding protein [Coriobacteriales bacterium]